MRIRSTIILTLLLAFGLALFFSGTASSGRPSAIPSAGLLEPRSASVDAVTVTLPPDVLVSPSSDLDPLDEPFVAVSTVNSNIIAAVSKDIVGGAANPQTGVSSVRYYFSSDAGLTWGSGLFPLQTSDKTFDFASDPTIASDSMGNFYACVLLLSGPSSGTFDRGVYLFESTDGGKTYGNAIRVFTDIGNPNGVLPDKPYITIDLSPTSPFKDTIYVAWSESNPSIPVSGIHIAHRRPGEAAFSTDQLISHVGAHNGVSLATGPNGEVYGAWQGVVGNPLTLLMNASIDGGITFSSALGVSPGHDFRFWALVGALSSSGFSIPGLARVNSFPSIDIDRSNGPNRGKIYLVWAESTNQINSDIFMMTLTLPAPGTTIQAGIPFKVSPSGSNQLFPVVHVDATNGAVNVVYYDFSVGGGNINPFLARSTNGAAGFGPALRLSQASTSPGIQSNIIGANDGGIGIGDYIGLTADSGVTRAIWTDTRNGKQEIFTAAANFGDGGTKPPPPPPPPPNAPANDTCSAPTAIASLPFTDALDTTTATSASDDPVSCSNGKDNNTVWYSFTATTTTMVGVDTSGSAYDTVLSVFTGSCGSLVRVACNDDFGNGLGTQSLLTFQAQSGTTYLIEIGSKASGGGSLKLRVGFPTVTSIAFGKGPDGAKALVISGAGFVNNNARAILQQNGVDTILPTTFFTSQPQGDGTVTAIIVSMPKLKKLVQPGVQFLVRVESPIGSGTTSVPILFTR